MFEFELAYWGTCQNTFSEDQKHFVYARYMAIAQHGHAFDACNRRILDIGAGPTSMLLKCFNLKKGAVVDPLLNRFPHWVTERYEYSNIDVKPISGEEIDETGWDEVWIYNCLQHVVDPLVILRNAKRAAKVIRLFEWIDIPAHEGHPHELTADFLTTHIGRGEIVELQELGCYGRAFCGVFTVSATQANQKIKDVEI